MFGAAVFGLALAASSAQAAELIVYEGFDLTDRVNGDDLNGSAGGSSSIGLTGAWQTTAAGNMTYTNGLSWTYVDPDVSPVGGAVNSGQTSQNYVKAGRQLPALSGSTVWGSFLVKGSVLTVATAPLGLPVGGATLDHLYGEFAIEPKGYVSESTIAVDDATARVNAAAGSSWMIIDTTYMTLFKIDNINVDDAVVGVSLWLMTQGQYDNLIRRGVSETVLEAGLNSVTLGTADNQLWGRVRGSLDLASGKAVSWAVGDWLRMINNTADNNVTFDEIRLATSHFAAAGIPRFQGTTISIR